jgi:hypothetical protein
LLVERILSDGLRTADGLEVLSRHQTTAEEQIDYKQRLEYLDDHCDFSPDIVAIYTQMAG